MLSNLPVTAGVAAMLLLAWDPFRIQLERRPVLWTGALFVATRLLFLALVVGLFGHVSLDLTTYFEAQGRAVLSGQMPYRDFACSYAPLFPFVMAPATLLPWPIPAIFLLFVAFDLITLVTVGRMAGTAADGARAGWLYAAAPITWYFLVRYGQDEALSAAILTLAALALRQGRALRSGLLLGLGFCVTKFTFGLALPPFWLVSRARSRLSLGVFLPVVGIFGLALLAGLPVWQPLLGESAELGFGPSLWRLPVLFTPLVLGRWAGLILAAGLGAAWWWFAKRAWEKGLDAGLVLTAAVFLLLSPKVLPMYLTPFWPFAALWAAKRDDRTDLWLLAALNLFLGIWWYVDAGGVQGMFGPVVSALAVGVTGAIPILLLFLIRRLLTREPTRAS